VHRLVRSEHARVEQHDAKQRAPGRRRIQRGVSDEVTSRLHVHRPGKAGLEWTRRIVHVLAVQAHARLEAERVAGAEAARLHVRVRERPPCARRERRGQHHLEAVLAGVARTRDEPVAEERSVKTPQRGRCGIQPREGVPRELARIRALHRDHGEVRSRHDLDVASTARGEPVEPFDVLLRGAGVDDEPKRVVGEEVGNQIVHHATLLVQHARVECATGRVELRDVVGERVAEEVARAGAENLHDAHVRDVEHPRRAPHRMVLLDLRAVVKRHLPAAEVDELCARLAVKRNEWRLLQHAAPNPPDSLRSAPHLSRGEKKGEAIESLRPLCPRYLRDCGELRRCAARAPRAPSVARPSSHGLSPDALQSGPPAMVFSLSGSRAFAPSAVPAGGSRPGTLSHRGDRPIAAKA